MTDWRGMDSAPKDGTEILLSLAAEGAVFVVPGFWMYGVGWKGGFLVRGPDTWKRGDARPFAWMPKPEPMDYYDA